MVDLLFELKSLKKRTGDLYNFAVKYFDILKMHFIHRSFFFQFCDQIIDYFIKLNAYTDRVESVWNFGDFGTLFGLIATYNKLYEDLEEYTYNGALKPWDYRDQEIVEGTDDITEYLNYKKSVIYLYDFHDSLIQFPKKFIYLED